MKIQTTQAVVIDFQQRIVPVMDNAVILIQNAERLIKGLKILEIPILVTEQYPKGLGKTVSRIAEALGNFTPIEKNSFSCTDEPAFIDALDPDRENIILFGIETHICLQQTALGLLECGYLPYVPLDCTSSRSAFDKSVAEKRLIQSGAVPATAESLLFELLKVAKGDQFKEISRLVK